MAKETYSYPYSDEKGNYTFRTIGGRKVKIYEHQSLADAMIESGKFKGQKNKPGMRESYRKEKEKDFKEVKERLEDWEKAQTDKSDDVNDKLNAFYKKQNDNFDKYYESYNDERARENRYDEIDKQRGTEPLREQYKQEGKEDLEKEKDWRGYRNRYQKTINRSSNPDNRERYVRERDMAQREIDKARNNLNQKADEILSQKNQSTNEVDENKKSMREQYRQEGQVDLENIKEWKQYRDANQKALNRTIIPYYAQRNLNEINVANKEIEKSRNNLNQKADEILSKKDKSTNDKTTQGKNYRNALTKLNDKSIEDGTYDLDTGKKVDFGNEGYNVSFEQSSDNYSDSEYYDKIEECRKLCDGKVYGGKFGGSPEISFYTKDKATAMQIMEKYNQHSIYDNSIGDVIENANYNAETNKVNYQSTNETMNNAIREKADKGKSTEEKFGYNDARDILNQLNSEGSDFTFGEIGTDKYNQDYKEAGKLKAEVSVFMPDERGYTTRELEIPIDKNETRASFEEKLRDWQSRHSSPDTWEDEDFKSTNDTMNNAIREKASKKKEVEQDLPKATEIKTQGTSNRKEVSENIQAHILDFYDSPDDFVEQMDAMSWLPNNWKRGEQLAQDGSYEIYYDDQREFLNSLKINPKGKEFSDDKVFQMYNSLIGRESAKLYDRIKRNQFNQYKKDHPLTKMTFEDFKDMNKR